MNTLHSDDVHLGMDWDMSDDYDIFVYALTGQRDTVLSCVAVPSQLYSKKENYIALSAPLYLEEKDRAVLAQRVRNVLDPALKNAHPPIDPRHLVRDICWNCCISL